MSDQTLGSVYFEEVADRVRLRIRADRRGRPPELALVLKTIETRFVDPGFDVNELRRIASPSKATLRAFERELGRTPGVYLKRRRLEMAELALAATTERELTVAEVARMAGYANHRSFARVFQEQVGHAPSRGRRPAETPAILRQPPLEGERATPWRRLLTGQVAGGEGREAVRRLRLRLCVGMSPLPEEGRIYLSYPGDPHARLVAEALWTVARDLPARPRRALVCEAVRFRSPALFQLLSEAAGEAAARGDAGEHVARAELALEVVEEHGSGFGDELHDLRALAWARLGEARLQAGDLAGAEQALRFAREAWQAPRPRRDAAADLEVRWLESSLHIARRLFDDACELTDEAIERLRAAEGDPLLLARALKRRALVAARRGEAPQTAMALLREAEGMIDEEAQPELMLAIRLHLARASLDAGHASDAERLLPRLRVLSDRLGDGAVQVRTTHLEAVVCWQQGRHAEAEALMLQAREAFLARGEIASAALVSIEIARLHRRLLDHARVRQAIAETVPLVESLAVHPQSMAALRELRSAQAEGGELTPERLDKVRASISACGDAKEIP